MIACQKIWQTKGRVMVLINRDTIVDLSKDEVDLQKTFAKKPVKAVKKKGKKKFISKVGAAKPQVAPKPQARPLAAPAAKPKNEGAPTGNPAPLPAAKMIKHAPQQPKASTALPAPPAVPPSATKSQEQGPVASVKKPAAVAIATPSRANLPLAKPSLPQPPKPSFWAANMVNISLVALLVLLAAGFVAYKKQQKK
jgi:hypothetical protein